MKKLIFTLALILSISFTYAQNIFDKYEDSDEVSSVIVTDEMFKLLKEIEPESAEAKEEISVLSDLTGLKVFSTKDATVGSQIKKDADTYIKTGNMSELMRINDKDAKVKFFVVKGAKAHIVKELAMIVTKKTETVVVLVSGTINLKKLSKLNSKIKVIDGKYLKKVEEAQNKQ